VNGRSDGGSKKGLIIVQAGASVVGCHLDVSEGHVFIGSDSVVEPGAFVKGPVIIGNKTCVRCGAYIREHCMLGDDCIIRGEMKNVVIMDHARLAHPSYVGDSVLGTNVHFGYGVVAANLRLDRRPIVVRLRRKVYDTGRKKHGVIMGDDCEIGVNTVFNPGTLIAPKAQILPLQHVGPGLHRA
jgi:NDP-sugar pyrophosphorylase family protein